MLSNLITLFAKQSNWGLGTKSIWFLHFLQFT